MSLFYEAKRESYAKTRAVSAGAGVTMVAKSGEYVAHSQCAKRVAEILGSRGLKEQGDGILESFLVYPIPTEDMPGALEKLSRVYSVALVDYTGGGFALVFKIERKAGANGEPEQAKGASIDLDEF